MIPKMINFKDKLDKFTDHWSPKIIAEMNDYQFKLTTIQGEFVWHKHDKTDEVFIVLGKAMRISPSSTMKTSSVLSCLCHTNSP